MKINSILLLVTALLFLTCPLWTLQAQNSAPNTVNYASLMTKAPRMIQNKFHNKHFLIKKQKNEIYCKFGLDSKAREYYGKDLEIKVRNVFVQHGQLLIEYSPNFYLVVDDFSDFEMYDLNGRKIDIHTNRPKNNYQQPAARPRPTRVVTRDVRQRPVNRKPLMRKPLQPVRTYPKATVSAPTKTTKSSFQLVDFDVPSKKNRSIKKAKTLTRPYNHQLANPKNSWLKKNKSTSQKSNLIDIKFRNLAEEAWNNPVEQGGNIVLFGCANGRCAAPVSDGNLTSADIDGKRCKHSSASGVRCHRNTQWPDGLCAFH